jgi:biopolymer transport protein ExbB
MMAAFGSVASGDVASAKPVVLAAGVSKAIVTTVFGLTVAIPAMAFYAWFRRRASRQISNLETASLEVLTAIIGVGSKAGFIDRIDKA